MSSIASIILKGHDFYRKNYCTVSLSKDQLRQGGGAGDV
jgi:hypothetical protein